jgi:glycosyltransferase involved in cell wall biosynthesis
LLRGHHIFHIDDDNIPDNEKRVKLKPLVSVVIPTKNSAKTIEACIMSVFGQSYQNIETIIVDTKSTDDTVRMLSRMKCKIVSTTWKLLGARYEGFKVASGEYIVLLDSDQILENSSIERSVLLSQKYDMLCLEEKPSVTKNWIDKMFEADRRLVHREFDIQKDPVYGTLLPRFYRRDILENAFKHIPESLFPFVIAYDHAIIYYEAWKFTTKVWIVPNAVWHIEPNSLIELWRKNFCYGKSARKLLRHGYYNDFLRKKVHFRKSKSNLMVSKDKILSTLLLLLKGAPYFMGLYFLLSEDY